MTRQCTDLFLEFAAQTRPAIERCLERYTEFGPGCPPRLYAAIRHSLLAPGKRLRPLMVLSAAQTCGSDWELALPAACAVEMVHTYSLIHDDLPAMDDDDLRRGRPSCHAAFDEATAILAGDALAGASLRSSGDRKSTRRNVAARVVPSWRMRPERPRWWVARPTTWPPSTWRGPAQAGRDSPPEDGSDADCVPAFRRHSIRRPTANNSTD